MPTVYWQAYQSSGWNTLSPSHYTIREADGTIDIKQSGYALLPDVFCLAVDAEWMERVPTVSAEMIKSMVNAVGLIDTALWGPGFSGSIFPALGAGWNFGWSSWLPVIGQPRYYPSGYPTDLGIYNYTLNPIGGVNNTVPHFDYDPTAWRFVVQGPCIGFAAGTSPPTGGIIGANSNISQMKAGCQLTVPLGIIGFDKILARLPDGTEILQAKLQLRAPSGLTTFDYDEDIQCGWNFNFDNEPSWGPQPGGNVNATQTHTIPDMRWGLLGKTKAGDWVNLGTAIGGGGAGGGTLAQGKSVVIDVTDFVKLMLAYRDSPYVTLALMPGAIGDLATSIGGITGDASLALAIRDAYWSYDIGSANAYPDYDPRKLWYGHMKWRQIVFNGAIGFEGGIIQFKLPQGVVKTQRLPYGNWPGMKPRA